MQPLQALVDKAIRATHVVDRPRLRQNPFLTRALGLSYHFTIVIDKVVVVSRQRVLLDEGLTRGKHVLVQAVSIHLLDGLR